MYVTDLEKCIYFLKTIFSRSRNKYKVAWTNENVHEVTRIKEIFILCFFGVLTQHLHKFLSVVINQFAEKKNTKNVPFVEFCQTFAWLKGRASRPGYSTCVFNYAKTALSLNDDCLGCCLHINPCLPKDIFVTQLPKGVVTTSLWIFTIKPPILMILVLNDGYRSLFSIKTK